MPDAKAGSYAALAGTEIVNAQRTIKYIQQIGLPLSVSEDCWCADIRELLNCEAVTATADYQYPSAGYPADSTPVSDPAPWYDPAIPESGDFLGFLPVEFEGLGSTYTRPSFDNIGGGALLGKLRPQGRVLTWRGFLIGRTCCAAEYGVSWLTAMLAEAGGCDGCNGAELDILLCCPEVTGGAVPPNTSCGPAQVPPIGIMDRKNAFRTFYNTGLIGGPERTGNDRQIGCGHCDQEAGCLIEVEFSILAGNPFMHKDPVEVCRKPFPPCGVCPGDADLGFWQKINTTAYPAVPADAELCANLLECLAAPEDCINDPNCPLPTLPTIPGFEDPCGCTPYNTTDICCEVSNDIYGQFFEGIPQIRIFAGTEDLHNVSVKFYENPQERTCTDTEMFDVCNLCDEVTIRFIPKNSTLVIDGLTKQINVECIGDNINPGESLVSSVYQWPTFKCVDYIVKISADCNFTVAANAEATICVIPREM